MSDLIIYTIKSFLYERQEPEEGQLDGTFYLCKGDLRVSPETVIHKSIFPNYVIIERYRGIKNKIYYKVYINRTDNGVDLIKKKNECTHHYFTKPIGAIHILTTIMQMVPNQIFTIIIEGNSICNYVVKFNNMNYEFTESKLQIILQNVLYHYEYVDFSHHQQFNKLL